MAKRISIINFKGGVGKTTLAFHLGTLLAWSYEARVLLVDVDHQSSLSILCMRKAGWDRAVEDRRIVNLIFEPFAVQSHGVPDSRIISTAPMRDVDSDYDDMDIVAASLELDDIEIGLTAVQQGNGIRDEWNKRTLICQWIEEAGIDEEYDYIIFDCPPATKVVSQNAIAASHGYIIPVVPEAVMERGTPHLRNLMRDGIDRRIKGLAMYGDTRAAYVPDTELVGLVVTRIQTHGRTVSGYTNDHTRHLRTLERSWGDDLIRPFIIQGVGVSEALTQGVPVYNLANTQNVGGRQIEQLYYELIAEIKRRIDTL